APMVYDCAAARSFKTGDASAQNRRFYAFMPQLYQPKEPNWQNQHRVIGAQLSAALKSSLLDSGSLTARLVAVCEHFEVVVQRQFWGFPRPSERRLLQLNARRYVLIREVALVCDGQPVVFARSVMPAESLSGALRHLRRFGNRSLGSLLYADPDLHRSDFELARASAGLFRVPETVYAGDSAIWGRRSRFILKDKPLMVSEIFLPGFKC
ncbi:MAG: chorismate--pyruvate lyase family protein, partial [Pseudomonadales bacterium]